MEFTSKSEKFLAELKILLSSPRCIYVGTTDEGRFFRLFTKFAKERAESKAYKDFGVYTWSCNVGLLDISPQLLKNGEEAVPVKREPSKSVSNDYSHLAGGNTQQKLHVRSFREVYDYAIEHPREKCYILKDLHLFLDPSRVDYPETVRRVRDLIFAFREGGGTLILLGIESLIPAELRDDIVTLPLPRPDDAEIDWLLSDALSSIKNNNPKLEFCIDYTDSTGKLFKSKHPNAKELRQRFIYNLRGLNENEINNLICYIIVKNRGLFEESIEDVKESKRNRISQFECLEFVAVPTEIEVGGHDDIKEYIHQRGLYLQPEVRDKYHLKPPKGILAVGVTGSGKSIMAKYIGHNWGVPVIRLDMGAVYGRYLGESEARLREALNLVEAIAPCVLWVDEVEKSVGKDEGASGTASRVLGKLLTWMSERQEMVYMFCTANNVGAIPPEFVRSGRFDTVRWFDLPTLKDCEEIIGIHCRVNGYERVNINELAHVAVERNLTGAEIEHAIIESNYVHASTKSDASSILRDCLSRVKSYAASHENDLFKARKHALENYEFTSEAVRLNVENLVNKRTANIAAIEAEHNMN